MPMLQGDLQRARSAAAALAEQEAASQRALEVAEKHSTTVTDEREKIEARPAALDCVAGWGGGWGCAIPTVHSDVHMRARTRSRALQYAPVLACSCSIGA